MNEAMEELYRKTAIEILCKMDRIEADLIIKGLINNKVMYSENGILWDLPLEYRDTVEELANKGNYVYHVIKGMYEFSGELVELISYLVVTEEDLDSEFESCIALQNKSFSVFSYVDNKTWGEKEFGSVGVKFRHGGLIRTM